METSIVTAEKYGLLLIDNSLELTDIQSFSLVAATFLLPLFLTLCLFFYFHSHSFLFLPLMSIFSSFSLSLSL